MIQDITCGLSGLGMNKNPGQTGLILLTPEEFLTKGNKFTAKTEFKPFLPPIFGEFSLGGLINIQPNTTTRILEKFFGLPVDVIVSCLSSNNFSPYSKGFATNRSNQWFKGNVDKLNLLAGFKFREEETSDYLAMFGFKANAETSFSFEGFTVEWGIRKRLVLLQNWEVLATKPVTSRAGVTPQEVLNFFSEHTGIWPGFPADQWQKLYLLSHSLNGMFFRKDVFELTSQEIKNDRRYRSGIEEYLNHPENGLWAVQKAVADSNDRTVENKARVTQELQEDLFNLYGFPMNRYDLLMDFETNQEEFLATNKLLFLLEKFNKLLAPTLETPLPVQHLQVMMDAIIKVTEEENSK